MYRSLSSLVPKAEDLLNFDVDELGNILLTHLKSHDGQSGNSVYQNGLQICELVRSRGRQGRPLLHKMTGFCS